MPYESLTANAGLFTDKVPTLAENKAYVKQECIVLQQ